MITPRQRQIIALVAEGFTDREIAEQLVVSMKTVEGYQLRIRDALDARNRAHVVHLAWRQGLLAPVLIGSER